mmetsp:Transcript_59472/g.81259  ORF Transcript_59472/g.81259 Transcript_59472/m.81259 type:complete len:246 (-) Transcript_59472:320-1057(-)
MASTKLTISLIKKVTKEYDPEIVRRIKIPRASISRIENLETCLELLELILPHNEIQRIENIDCLKKLRILDLSYNRISRIENMDGLDELEYFDLRGNQVHKVDDLLAIAQLSELKRLYLRTEEENGPATLNTACTNDAEYPMIVIKLLPRLEILDDESILLKQKLANRNGRRTDPESLVFELPDVEPWYHDGYWEVQQSNTSTEHIGEGSTSTGKEIEALTSEYAGLEQQAMELLLDVQAELKTN